MTSHPVTRRSILRGLLVCGLPLSSLAGLVGLEVGSAQEPASRPKPIAKPNSAQVPQPHTVVLSGFKFQPESLSVLAGNTVVWINKDIVPHTVTETKELFDSGEMQPGKSWKLVTKKPGTYRYLCTLHPNMEATLIVK